MEPQVQPSRRDSSLHIISSLLVQIGAQDPESNGGTGIVRLLTTAQQPGAIFFRNASVVDAEIGHVVGVDAVLRLSRSEISRFNWEVAASVQRSAIRLELKALLERIQLHREAWKRLTVSLTSLDAALELEYDRLADHLAEIPDELNPLLKQIDGLKTARQLLDLAPVGEEKSLSALAALVDRNLCRRADGVQAAGDADAEDIQIFRSPDATFEQAESPTQAERSKEPVLDPPVLDGVPPAASPAKYKRPRAPIPTSPLPVVDSLSPWWAWTLGLIGGSAAALPTLLSDEPYYWVVAFALGIAWALASSSRLVGPVAASVTEIRTPSSHRRT